MYNWSFRYVHVGVREVKWMVLGLESEEVVVVVVVGDLRFDVVVVDIVGIIVRGVKWVGRR